MSDLIERMRSFELDHEPHGWPAVQMRDISALCDRLEQAEAQVAELEDALVWALGKLSIEVPVTGSNVTYIRAFEKADKALSSDGRAYLLRQKAEAVERFGQEIGVFDPEYDDQEYVEIPRREVTGYAQSLRQQADEAERAGGEK